MGKNRNIVPDHYQDSAPRTPDGQAYGDVTVESGPDVPTYGGANGETTVNTAAIKAFGENLNPLIDSLRASQSELAAVRRPAAGAFPSAYAISDSVTTTSADVATAALNAIEALTDLRATMQKVASDYETSESDFTMDAAKLAQYMAETSPSITATGTAGRGTA